MKKLAKNMNLKNHAMTTYFDMLGFVCPKNDLIAEPKYFENDENFIGLDFRSP